MLWSCWRCRRNFKTRKTTADFLHLPPLHHQLCHHHTAASLAVSHHLRVFCALCCYELLQIENKRCWLAPVTVYWRLLIGVSLPSPARACILLCKFARVGSCHSLDIVITDESAAGVEDEKSKCQWGEETLVSLDLVGKRRPFLVGAHDLPWVRCPRRTLHAWRCQEEETLGRRWRCRGDKWVPD